MRLPNLGADLATNIPIVLDRPAPLAASLDPHAASGRQAVHPELRVAWTQAIGYYQRGSKMLRVQLRLKPPSADDLHSSLLPNIVTARSRCA